MLMMLSQNVCARGVTYLRRSFLICHVSSDAHCSPAESTSRMSRLQPGLASDGRSYQERLPVRRKEHDVKNSSALRAHYVCYSDLEPTRPLAEPAPPPPPPNAVDWLLHWSRRFGFTEFVSMSVKSRLGMVPLGTCRRGKPGSVGRAGDG